MKRVLAVFVPVACACAMVLFSLGSEAVSAQGLGTGADRDKGKEKDTVATPELLAVKFHADWCRKCERMGSVIEDLRGAFEDEPALFVTLDVTDSTMKRQAEYMAGALDVGKIWTANDEKTGVIRLVDFDSKEELDVLTAEDSREAMKQKLRDALRSAQ